MNIIIKIICHAISLPARIKGMRFGKNSYIGPGYDWISVNLKNITLDQNVMIGRNAWLQTGEYGKINIGDNTQIGRNVLISASNKITIGNSCLLSYNISITDHDHELYQYNLSPIESGLTKAKKIIIEDQCFIGAHSFILKGVTLGKHCVVGANSVVTKSFPAYSVIAGNPAKLIKKIIKKHA